MFARASTFDGFKQGTLIRMNHNFGADKISKQHLREALGHFGQPAYIDMHGKAKQITLRFAAKMQADSFLAKVCSVGDGNAKF